jgi:hypothetical protein
LAVRDVKLRYRQTALGISWVVLQPLLASGILAFVFATVAGLTKPERGSVFIFVLAGFVGWSLFSAIFSRSSQSLIQHSVLISKVFVMPSTSRQFCYRFSFMRHQLLIGRGRFQTYDCALFLADDFVASPAEVKSVRRLICGIAVALAASSSVASAVVLDWNTVTWPPGSLSNAYHVDPNTPGNNISITMTGDTSSFSGGSPSIVNNNLGGTGKPALQLQTGGLLPGQSIVVTINFNYAQGVYVQNLNILDVDFSPGIVGSVGGWQDQIKNISAVTATNQTVNPVAVAGGSAVTVTGNQTSGWTATGNATAGSGSSAGNVSLDFGNFQITSITFTFANGPGAPILLTNQIIGLDNITFLLTPERFTGVSAMILCGLAVILCIFSHSVRYPRDSEATNPRGP